MLYLFGKKLGTQHYPTVAGVGYTTPTYEIMDVGCWVHNNQLYKSWLLGTQQPTNFRRCVVLCWFLLVQPMSGQQPNICQDAKIVKWPLFYSTTSTHYNQWTQILEMFSRDQPQC